ncbi:MAG: helix-turn-helix domain-containing protein [Rhodospirillales bacterium]
MHTRSHKNLGNNLPRRGYSIPEFGAVIGVGRTRLYEMIKSGELRTVKLGKRRIIPASEIDRLLGDVA